jgi:hypothetical protein
MYTRNRIGPKTWWRKKKSDSDFLSYNLMLNSGKKKKYSNCRGVVFNAVIVKLGE